MEERSEEPPAPEIERAPAYSTKTLRACCLAPAIAVAAIFIFAVAAGLFSPRPRLPSGQRPQAQDLKRREAFVRFGREYFAIAARADEFNEKAFKELDALVRGNGSIGDVHTAFAEAGKANERASAEFKELAVPPELLSQSKVRQSLDVISEAYDLRRQACDTIIGWNGDIQDSATAEKYQQQAEEVNRLTMEGLRHLGNAAADNGITKDDARKFLPLEDHFEGGGI